MVVLVGCCCCSCWFLLVVVGCSCWLLRNTSKQNHETTDRPVPHRSQLQQELELARHLLVTRRPDTITGLLLLLFFCSVICLFVCLFVVLVLVRVIVLVVVLLLVVVAVVVYCFVVGRGTSGGVVVCNKQTQCH